MRILHLLSQTELTGAEVYAQNLIQSQHEKSLAVFVISDRMHVQLPVTPESLPLSTSQFSVRWKNIWKLRKFLIEKQIQVIHCHSRGAVRHASWARWNLPVALVTTLHGRQHFSWSKRILHIYGELMIAVCENVQRAMKLDFKMPESSIRVLRNPVSFSVDSPVNKIKGDFRLGILGRSSGPKGKRIEELAANCFATWLKTAPGLKIEIVAPKPEVFSKGFQSLIESLNQTYPDSVRVLGQVSNLREKLKDYDLTICSGRIAVESLLEQVPVLAMGEYCSHGLVTLETLTTNLESNFGDIGADQMEKPLDVDDLAERVQEFLLGARPSTSELEALKQAAIKEFDPTKIQDQVLEIYRAAIFKRHVPAWIPVLMYHKIPDEELQTRHRIFVTKKRFQKHLQFFDRNGFQTLTFSDLEKFWTGQKPYTDFPRKPLMLTFDDGYVDNLTTAEPLLRKFKMRATIFLLGNHRILENTWDAQTGETPERLMTLEQKQKLDPKVWEIGSHGFDHLHLPQVSTEAAFHEMHESKLQLEKDFSREIVSFAYPFGSTNQVIAGLAQEAGYRFAVNTDQGGLHLADQPHSIFRVNIFPEDGFLQLWKKTSSWYRRSFFRKRGR